MILSRSCISSKMHVELLICKFTSDKSWDNSGVNKLVGGSIALQIQQVSILIVSILENSPRCMLELI